MGKSCEFGKCQRFLTCKREKGTVCEEYVECKTYMDSYGNDFYLWRELHDFDDCEETEVDYEQTE